MIDTALIDYAVRHRESDVARLLLQSKTDNIDMPLVAQQIEGWQTASEKWPTLAMCDQTWYPPRLNREQSSSEATARYKASLFVKSGNTLADLTGGMGIDSLFATKAGAIVDYVEMDCALCDGMRHNLEILGLKKCTVHCADSMAWLTLQDKTYNTIYIDPARRNSHGERVSAFEDCTPNLLEHIALLLAHGNQLVVKASPMIDLATARRQLAPHLCETHIVAVKGECKEILFVCRAENDGEVRNSCVNIEEPLQPETFVGHAFDYYDSDEAAAIPTFCQTMGRYIYEPHAALMKGGPYNLICQCYGVEKLSRNTHLYTSLQLMEDFPGRIFEVLSPTPLTTKTIKKHITDGKAHVISRNHPATAAALQKQLHLKEGGDLFVIATTIGTQKSGFVCRRIK